MKGLYVYGALSMALAFAVGMHVAAPLLMALAITACGVAALSEALSEVVSFYTTRDGGAPTALCLAVAGLSISSWVLTGIALTYSIVVLVGG